MNSMSSEAVRMEERKDWQQAEHEIRKDESQKEKLPK